MKPYSIIAYCVLYVYYMQLFELLKLQFSTIKISYLKMQYWIKHLLNYNNFILFIIIKLIIKVCSFTVFLQSFLH